MTFGKTKMKLEELAQDGILEVLLAEGEPLENIPCTAADQGFIVLDTTHVTDNIHRVAINKSFDRLAAKRSNLTICRCYSATEPKGGSS